MWADIMSQTLDGATGSHAAASPVIQSGKGRIIAVVGDRLPPDPGTPSMMEQGAVGGFYETRAFTAFAVPAATPRDVVKRLADTLMEAGTDDKVKALLASYLISQPLSFEAADTRFKRDIQVMLAVLKDFGVKPD